MKHSGLQITTSQALNYDKYIGQLLVRPLQVKLKFCGMNLLGENIFINLTHVKNNISQYIN